MLETGGESETWLVYNRDPPLHSPKARRGLDRTLAKPWKQGPLQLPW